MSMAVTGFCCALDVWTQTNSDPMLAHKCGEGVHVSEHWISIIQATLAPIDEYRALVLCARREIAFRRREFVGVELGEIDWIEQQRREAPVADGVGENAARERKQDRRTIDEQDRLEQTLRNASQTEQPAIEQLDIVDDAEIAAGMSLELQGGLVGVVPARARIHIDVDPELRILAGALQGFRGARAFEGQIFDVEGEHREVRRRLGLRASLRRGRGLRRSLGRPIAIRLLGLTARGLVFRHRPRSFMSWLAWD